MRDFDYSSLFNFFKDPLFVFNQHGVIVRINQQAAEVFPQISDSDTNIDIHEVFDSQSCSRIQKYLENEDQNSSITLSCTNSEEKYLASIINRQTDGDEVHFIISLESSGIKDQVHNDEFFRQLVDNSSDVIVRIDERIRTSYISTSSIHLIGYTPEEILERNDLMSFVHPDDRARTYSERKSSADKGEEFQTQRTRLLHKNGSTVWVEILIRREFDKEGNNTKSVSTHRNITDRVHAHRQLEVIKERYELAVEAGHTGIFDYDFKSKKFYPDYSLLRLFGLSMIPEGDQPEKWLKYIFEEDRNNIVRSIQHYLNDGLTYFEETFRITHKSRVTLWVMARGKIFYKENGPSRIVCSITDITERVDASEQLKDALLNFESIFNALPDLFFKLNKLGDYLEVKAGDKSDLILKDARSYKGKNIRDTFHPESYELFYKCLGRSFESKIIESCEYSLVLDGRTKHFEARIISVTDNEAVVLIRNMTDAVRINQELISAKKIAEEALNEREVFFSTMNHEIRTPLNVVVGMSHLLLDQNPREDQLNLLNTLKFSSENLLSLINDLLDFSKIQAEKIEFESREFNLEEFINNIFESYRLSLQDKKVELKKNWSKDVPKSVFGDSNRLAQILNNLLNNAIKFTEKGQIILGVSVIDRDENDGKIQFSVSDTGIGIPENKLEKIFEPYQQGTKDTARKYGGTGLGLTIIQKLIELQEGTIKVSSSEGKGTEFKVILPFKFTSGTPASIASERAVLKQTLREKQIKVLYADDVLTNQFLMKGYCKKWEVKLDTAANGAKAVEMTSNSIYDLILLDLHMPEMDGFEAARKIRVNEKDLNWDTPIIAVTGDYQTDTKSRLLDAGFNDMIIKPVDPQILFDKITGNLDDTILNIKDFDTQFSEDEEWKNANHGIIDFKQIDTMYQDIPDMYNQLMELMMKEYHENRDEIIKSVRKGDFTTFRRIRHSMTSNMKLFRMDKIHALLNEIKSTFENNSLSEDAGEYAQVLKDCFDELLSQFELKQQQLC